MSSIEINTENKQNQEVPENPGKLPLIAYSTRGIPMKMIRASPDRDWMSAAKTTFANRCLPMRMANEHGWFILNPTCFEVEWNGGVSQKDLVVRSEGGIAVPAMSHFGHGVLTFWIPYLFRTPPGINLHVRGPVNQCKDGIHALDAIVETDWAVASFPMSWKMTRIGCPVRFEADEPICMISPLQRGLLRQISPEHRTLWDNPELSFAYESWSQSRKEHNKNLIDPKVPRSWQKHYFVGKHPAGGDEVHPEHEIRVHHASFKGSPQFVGGPFENLGAGACPIMALQRKFSGTPDSVANPSFFHLWREFSEQIRKRCALGVDWMVQDRSGSVVRVADLKTLLPKDLYRQFAERLKAWGDSKDLGPITGLQASLFEGGRSYRLGSVGSHENYAVFPIAVSGHETNWKLKRNRAGFNARTLIRFGKSMPVQENTLYQFSGNDRLEMKNRYWSERTLEIILIEATFSRKN